jgi:hypothetical protein
LKLKLEQLSTKVVEFEQILGMLRSEDDIHASNTLTRLRLGENISTIINGNTSNNVSYSENSNAISDAKPPKLQQIAAEQQ